MYRTILVHVDVEPGAAQRIRLAGEVAARFEARLIGMTAALPRPPVEALYAGIADAGIVGLERDQIAEDFKIAERQFRAIAAETGIKSEWRAVESMPTWAMANAAGAADLVIIGPERNGFLGDPYRMVNPGELLLQAGRAVVITPAGASELTASNVLVAWKNTREARRAVRDALPFLKRAKAVELVDIREKGELTTLDDAKGFLSAHGINVHGQALERDAKTIEEQLIAFAHHAQAELIVAGAYGHSRIRELIFGGVTRRLITGCPVACLLSH
jgi:nucleotide-binding universal stress UspA family protein